MRSFTFDRLDRYTLRLFAGPLVSVLATLLVAQLLERLLRLFDLAASAGAPLSSVLVMVANLVPHYLGLALPMSFTAAIFIAAARMSDDNEFDVMLTTGRSVMRIAAPYFALALALIPFNLYLFGELQPLTRYGYQLAVHDALQTGWDAKVEERRFIDAGNGITFSADGVGADGRSLTRVFVARRAAGADEVTTAAQGRFVPAPDGRGLLLQLDGGLTLRENDKAAVSTSRFTRSLVSRDISPTREPFRPRGDSLRERTLAELWHDMRLNHDDRAAAAFHGRLARVLILPLLPLMALPLGMASKRGRRSPGIVFATLALLLLDHALQFGQSLAENGRVAAVPAVWAPVLVFGVVSAWIFRGSLAWPGDNPVSRAVAALEGLIEGARPRLWRRRARSAGAAGDAEPRAAGAGGRP